MMRWIQRLTLLYLLIVGGGLKAQETGQICVLSYDDRNQNGLRDAGEPPIAHGIGLHLLTPRRVTIASMLLEESPDAARGLACFEGLPAGEYMTLMTSADYIAVSASSFNAAVTLGGAPVRFDFGVKPLTSAGLTTAPPNQTLSGVLFAAAASGLVSGLMLIIGLLIYFAVFRPRLKARH